MENKEFNGRCLRCFRPLKYCYCHKIESFETKSRFIILQHPKERKIRINTGRMSHLFLSNSEIIEGISFDEVKQVQKLLANGKKSVLLYPGENAVNLSKVEQYPVEELQIFVLDGTWPLARKMLIQSKCLQTLPRISFEANFKSRFSIKHQPHEACLSTIESIVVLLNELKRLNLESFCDEPKRLTALLDEVVLFHRNLATDPNVIGYRKKNFKLPEERTQSVKWTKRNLFYKDKSE